MLAAARIAPEGCACPLTVGVFGTQWGDEGKGKLTRLLAWEMQLVLSLPGRSQLRAHHRVLRETVRPSSVPMRCLYYYITPRDRQRRGRRPSVLIANRALPVCQGPRCSRLKVMGNPTCIMPYHH